MELINFTNPHIIYVICGVVFNLIYDLIISYLGVEHEVNRFTMAERIFILFIWPIPFIIMIFSILNSKKND